MAWKVTQGRARQVWNNRVNCTHVQPDKPMKKQTKPEVKKQSGRGWVQQKVLSARIMQINPETR